MKALIEANTSDIVSIVRDRYQLFSNQKTTTE